MFVSCLERHCRRSDCERIEAGSIDRSFEYLSIVVIDPFFENSIWGDERSRFFIEAERLKPSDRRRFSDLELDQIERGAPWPGSNDSGRRRWRRGCYLLFTALCLLLLAPLLNCLILCPRSPEDSSQTARILDVLLCGSDKGLDLREGESALMRIIKGLSSSRQFIKACLLLLCNLFRHAICTLCFFIL